MKNYSQPVRQAQGEKGFAMPMLIAIVAVVLVVGGVVVVVDAADEDEAIDVAHDNAYEEMLERYPEGDIAIEAYTVERIDDAEDES